MQQRNNDNLIKRDAAEIPGRPNLFDGSAANDLSIHNFAMRRLVRAKNVRIIVMPDPEPIPEQEEKKELTPRERQRKAMEKMAITLLNASQAFSEEQSIAGRILADGMKIKIKAVANYLSFAIREGRVIKVRRSQNPKRPSEMVAHFYLPLSRKEK